MDANDTPTKFTVDDAKKLDTYMMQITFCTCGDNGALCEGCWLAKTYHALMNRMKAAENCIKIAQEMLGSNLWQEKAWQRYLNRWREKR